MNRISRKRPSAARSPGRRPRRWWLAAASLAACLAAAYPAVAAADRTFASAGTAPLIGVAAMLWLGSPALIFVSMVLFGAGFGVAENATFALLIEKLPEAGASALWNLAYDAGYGAGPAVFGLFAARTGYRLTSSTFTTGEAGGPGGRTSPPRRSLSHPSGT